MNHKPMKMLIALLLVCALLVSHLPIVSVFAVDGDQTAQTEPDGAAEASLSETQATAEAAETASTQPETQPETREAETEPAVAPERSAEETGAEAASAQPGLQEEAEQYALDQTVVVDGVAIRLTAADGVFPQGARLEVRRAGAWEARIAEAAVAAQREEGRNVALSYTFDIKVVDREGNELQPADESLVQLSFALAQVESQNLDAQIYHMTEDMPGGLSAQELDVQTVGNIATVETDGFSFYTVEFTYEDKEYVLNGYGAIRLSTLMEHLGFSGEIQSWEVSDPTLFDIFLGDENDILYEYTDEGEEIPTNNGTIPWMLSLGPFSTTEWLKVVIDGIEYEIVVTDDDTHNTVPSGYVDAYNTYRSFVNTVWDTYGAVTNDPSYNSTSVSKPAIVKQSKSTTSATDFAAGLPLATIFIDQSKIGISSNDVRPKKIEIVAQGDFAEGLVVTDGKKVSYYPQKEGTVKTLPQAKSGELLELSGDLFYMIFENAAILPNGDRADLKITYSNAKIAVDQRLGEDDKVYEGYIDLANGASISYSGTSTQTFTSTAGAAVNTTVKALTGNAQGFTNSNTPGGSPMLGHAMDVHYQIVDKNGEATIDGTFIFAMAGINLDRDPYRETGNNYAKPLWYYDTLFNDINKNGVKDSGEDYLYKEHHFFSEAVTINSGLVSDFIYVRPNTAVQEFDTYTTYDDGTYNGPHLDQGVNNNTCYYYPEVILENGKVKFISNAYGNNDGKAKDKDGKPIDNLKGLPARSQAHDQAYCSGFVLLVNAKDGLSITASGHGGTGNSGMNTQIYSATQIWYRYTHSTGPNGEIFTTSEGNHGGTLDDKSDSGAASNKLEPNTYVVAEGKTVTYTMTPNPGFHIAKLQVEIGGQMTEILFNGSDPLSTMQPGDYYEFPDAAGNTCRLTALAGDGDSIKFTLKVPYAKHDEVVHVEWERTNASVTIKKITDNSKPGEFSFKIKAHKKEDVVSYSPVRAGSLYKDPGDGAYKLIAENDFVFDNAADPLASLVKGTVLMEKLNIPGMDESWGASLWKTSVRLSDLGIHKDGTDDDVLFVGFKSVADTRIGETLEIALDTGYSPTGPETIVFFYPGRTVQEDVITYWDFANGKPLPAGTLPPEEYGFKLEVKSGDLNPFIKFNVQQNYEYEVYEETLDEWELVSVDGIHGANKAIGYLSEATNSAPEHVFRNRELPDLEIKKETENKAPGNFAFLVTLKQAAVSAQSYQVGVSAAVDKGVISYSFTNYGAAFSVDGVVIPAGTFAYIDGSLQGSVFDKLLCMKAADGDKTMTLGTDEAGRVNTDATSPIKEWAEATQEEQIRKMKAGEDAGTLQSMGATYYFNADPKAVRPYALGTVAGVTPNDPHDPPDPSKGYWVTVSAGSSFTLKDLPHGVTYEIVEKVPIHWQQLSSANDSGNLTDDVTATFHNRQFLELTVAKTLVGNQASRDKYFKFTVKLENCVHNSQLTLDMTRASQAPDKTVATAYEAADMAAANRKDDDALAEGQQISVDGEGKAQFDVYLQHGQSILIKGIPYGASYTVTEVPEDYQPTLKFDGDDHTGDSATEEGTAIVLGTYNGEPGASDSFLQADTTLTVKNVRNGVVPTGVETGSLAAPGMMLLLTGALMSLLWLGRRRLDDG